MPIELRPDEVEALDVAMARQPGLRDELRKPPQVVFLSTHGPRPLRVFVPEAKVALVQEIITGVRSGTPSAGSEDRRPETPKPKSSDARSGKEYLGPTVEEVVRLAHAEQTRGRRLGRKLRDELADEVDQQSRYAHDPAHAARDQATRSALHIRASARPRC